MLNYGMVGGGPDGFIGAAHRKAIALDGSARLAAGCFSRKLEKSLQTAREFELDESRVYADYAQMAQAEAARPDGIDFVVVVTPNASHYPVCKAFMEAGIHVMCDKPLAVSVEEAEELAALAKDKDLLFGMSYSYSGHQTFKTIRDLIASGEIGEVMTVTGEYMQGWLAGDLTGNKQAAWRMDPKQSGGVNCLGDIGTHVENSLHQLTGLELTEVLASLERKKNRPLDDNDMVLLRYENGATGMLWTTQVAIGYENDMLLRVMGSKGSIEWRQVDCEKFILYKEDGMHICRRGATGVMSAARNYDRIPAGHPEGYLEALGNIYRSYSAAVAAKKKGLFTPDMVDYPTAEQGVAGLRFIQACLKSQAAGNVWTKVR